MKFTKPAALVKRVREHLRNDSGNDSGNNGDDGDPGWKEKIRSRDGWSQVASKYFMEWMMVWKDVTVGFTVAGIIAAFVPRSFFEWLFVGTAGTEGAGFWDTLQHAVVGPVAAFFTFIGSMGNIPLAAVLFANGVSFAGIMAFIFSDLVVFPVLRMNAKFYGWKMALYIAGIFLACIVATALLMHWGLFALDLLPEHGGEATRAGDRFAIDYTFWMNLGALVLTAFFAWLAKSSGKPLGASMAVGDSWIEKLLLVLTIGAVLWLAGGWWWVGWCNPSGLGGLTGSTGVPTRPDGKEASPVGAKATTVRREARGPGGYHPPPTRHSSISSPGQSSRKREGRWMTSPE